MVAPEKGGADTVRDPRGTLIFIQALLLSSIQKRVTGTLPATTPLFSSSEMPWNFPTSSIHKRKIQEPTSLILCLHGISGALRLSLPIRWRFWWVIEVPLMDIATWTVIPLIPSNGSTKKVKCSGSRFISKPNQELKTSPWTKPINFLLTLTMLLGT